MCRGSYVACAPATHVVPHFARVCGRRLKLTLYGSLSKSFLAQTKEAVAAKREKRCMTIRFSPTFCVKGCYGPDDLEFPCLLRLLTVAQLQTLFCELYHVMWPHGAT